MGFGSAVISFIVTAISLGYVPTLIRNSLPAMMPGIVIETPYFDPSLLLGLGILAGAFAFAQGMTKESNVRLSGVYGILRYVVTLYYTVVLLQMTGTIVIPTGNIGIQLTYLTLGTLIFTGILISMLRLLIKIAAPKDFEKKRATTK